MNAKPAAMQELINNNSMFSKVVFDTSVSSNIAQVDRATGTLSINPQIWNRLTGLEKEYVLLHEGGHLNLMTADEFKVNKYAIEKFIPVQTLTDAELGKRIIVLSQITDPANYVSGNFVSDILGAANDTLSIIGVGNKQRAADAAAAASNAVLIENTKSANTTKIIIIGGMLVIVIVVMFFIFKK